jgi:hypothetical protein
MKYILLLSRFLIISITQIFAQDCKALNEFNSFQGIKFGEQFTDSLKKYFKFEIFDSDSIQNYSLEWKMLSKNNSLFQKCYKWIQFGDNLFSNLTINCLTDGRVYEFTLMKVYDKNDIPSLEDSIEIVIKRLPKTFIRATEEITSLFGEMTRTEDKNDLLGYHLYRTGGMRKKQGRITFMESQ